jgi:carbon-monoxide dehydrogenase small subunit
LTTISLTINGEDHTVAVAPRDSLGDMLREKLALTGTHFGCEHGACGACTVDLDGRTVRSCNILAVMCEGRAVTTIEGLGDDPLTDLLRRHFHECHALQCGFCTPGMLITARDLLARVSDLNEDGVRAGLAGQICRCTGYAGIVAAVLASARELHGSRSATGGASDIADHGIQGHSREGAAL